MMLRRILFMLPVFTILNSAHATSFKLPDTGQTKCYQAVSPYSEIACASTGQDGAYAPRNPLSYTDNSNSTITDKNTGLVWQKCSVGQNNDTSCSGTTVTYNWYQATGTYDATYNPTTLSICGNLALPGGGWRLPSINELMDIVDYSIPEPGLAIQQNRFPNAVASSYWSSTANAGNPGAAWYVNFLNGFVYSLSKSDVNYVRCVRGEQ